MANYRYKDQNHLASNMKSGKVHKPQTANLTDKDFYKFAQYFFGLYTIDQSAIYSGGYLNYGRFGHNFGKGDIDRRSISELRAYANGLQTVDKYRKIVTDKDPKTGKPLLNVSFAPIKVMPKFMDQAMATMSDYKFRANPHASDAAASREKRRIAATMKMYTMPAIKQMEESLGMSPQNKPDMKGIETPEDVDILANKITYLDRGKITKEEVL